MARELPTTGVAALGTTGAGIAEALLLGHLKDAVRVLEASDATIDEIDAAMTDGSGHPLGPFALMDVVGLDVTLAISRALSDDREPGDLPAPMLEHLVRAGRLGRKTGRGFRDHAR